MPRLLLPALVLALAVSACDTTGEDVPTPTVTYDTLGVLRVPSQATYLRTRIDPDAGRARAYSLDSLGVRAGDRVSFGVTGTADLVGPGLPPSRTRTVIGVFSASSTLLADTLQTRVLDAIQTDRVFVTPPTGIDSLATDIPEDFEFSRATVTVPTDAEYVFLSVPDAYFSDNRDVGDGVRLFVLRPRR